MRKRNVMLLVIACILYWQNLGKIADYADQMTWALEEAVRPVEMAPEMRVTKVVQKMRSF